MAPVRTLGFALAYATLLLTGCSSMPPQSDAVGEQAAQYALEMQGTPYRYGGNTPHGFDCSGLVQWSYARAGARVPRTTGALWKSSHRVSLHRLRGGDLLFFNQDGKRSSHVAIYLGDHRFVHAPASGKHVSVGRLDDPYWRRHFAGARRPRIE